MQWDSLKDKDFIHQTDFGQQQAHKSKASAWFFHQGAREWMSINQGREYSKTMRVTFHLDAMQGI